MKTTFSATRKLRTGDQLINMVTGEKFCVASAATDGSVVTEEDGREVSAKELTVCKYLGNDTPLPTPKESDFTIADGNLSYLGESVQTGTLKIAGIIATFSGGVRLTVLGRDGETTDIFDYLIEEDKFVKIAGRFNTVKRAYAGENGIYAYVCGTEAEIKVPKEDGDEDDVESMTAETETVWFCQGREVLASFDMDGHPFGGRKQGFFERNTYRDGTEALVTTSKCAWKKVEDVEGYTHNVLEPLQDGTIVTQYLIELVTMEDDDEGEVCYNVKSFEKFVKGEVKTVRFINDEAKSLLIITDKGIAHTNNGYRTKRVALGEDVVRAALDYEGFVELKVDGDRHVTFVLANKEYDTVEIDVTQTADRGFVTEIREGNAA